MLRTVALSGGADSVVTLHKMWSEGKVDCAVHINYHLRGEESDRDMQLCVDVCSKLNIPLDIFEYYSVEEDAKTQGLGLEEYARNLRYTVFNDPKYAIIYVGHHKDDLAETILFRLVRGTGVNGLEPMKAVNGKYIRPLLDMTKQEVLDYTVEHELDFVVDSSNLTNDYSRNLIRNEIMPLLRELNPATVENLVEFAQNATDLYKDSKKVNESLVELLVTEGVSVDKLNSLTSSTRHMLFLEAMKLKNPDVFSLSKGEYNELLKLLKSTEGGYRKVGNLYFAIKSHKLHVLGERYSASTMHTIVEDLGVKLEVLSNEEVNVNGFVKVYDKEKGLEVRKIKSDDYVVVGKMKKKAYAFLNDKGVFSFERANVYGLLNGNQVLWVDLKGYN